MTNDQVFWICLAVVVIVLIAMVGVVESLDSKYSAQARIAEANADAEASKAKAARAAAKVAEPVVDNVINMNKTP